MPRQVPPLAVTTATLVVRSEDLASALAPPAEDPFPPVFATSRMIALLEIAAARSLVPLLEEGELSVGVSVDVRHTAATPLGGRVTATARYLGANGKLHRFEVFANDDAGEVGRGTHERAIVKTRRLLEGAGKRSGTGDGLR
jgi:predicted thioesterase